MDALQCTDVVDIWPVTFAMLPWLLSLRDAAVTTFCADQALHASGLTAITVAMMW